MLDILILMELRHKDEHFTCEGQSIKTVEANIVSHRWGWVLFPCDEYVTLQTSLREVLVKWNVKPNYNDFREKKIGYAKMTHGILYWLDLQPHRQQLVKTCVCAHDEWYVCACVYANNQLSLHVRRKWKGVEEKTSCKSWYRKWIRWWIWCSKGG